MNGAHDMGGTMGFGPVIPEKDEPVFHGDWEKRALSLSLAMGAAGLWNIDTGRHVRENRSPREYLDASYYQLWYLGLKEMLEARGLVGADELEAGRALRPGVPVPRVLQAANVPAAMARCVPYERAPTSEARFKPGMTVRTRNDHPLGHTRLPDTHAHGQGEQPHWLYCVAFTAIELWGKGADPAVTLSADCWEPYLDPA
jgi:nitrile hydratase beta subunit